MVEPVSRPLLEPNAVLAERFRLRRPLDDRPEPSWLAHDEVLDREVVVVAAPAREARGRELVDEAGLAGAVAHPGLARVYDAAYESRPPRPRVAYVVREWIDGQRLSQLLQEGPLRPARALELATQATEAIAALHARGIGHGRVHPGNVIVDRAGRLHLTDAGIGAVRADTTVDEATDVRDLGCLLYALTTGRWPTRATEQPAGGVTPAATDERGTLSPRLVRAGVPSALDALVMRVIEPRARSNRAAILTAKGLLTALEQTADAVGREERDALPPEPRPPARWRRAIPYAGVALGLVVLGTCSYSVGQDVGKVEGAEESVATIEEDIQRGTPGAPVQVRVNLQAATVRVLDVDPYGGGDKRENASAVPNAFDLEPSTIWETDSYRTKRFGELKPGVGLLVDLGAPTRVSTVLLDLAVPGAKMELRAGNALGPTETSLPVVANSTGQGRLRMMPTAPVSARYYLLWFKELPAVGGSFRAGIKEVAFFRQ